MPRQMMLTILAKVMHHMKGIRIFFQSMFGCQKSDRVASLASPAC